MTQKIDFGLLSRIKSTLVKGLFFNVVCPLGNNYIYVLLCIYVFNLCIIIFFFALLDRSSVAKTW